MNPSPEAIAWGKRQAAGSPRWTDAKWRQVGTIFGIVLADERAEADNGQADETDTMRDAA